MKIIFTSQEVKKAVAKYLSKKESQIKKVTLRRKSPKTEDVGSILVEVEED